MKAGFGWRQWNDDDARAMEGLMNIPSNVGEEGPLYLRRWWLHLWLLLSSQYSINRHIEYPLKIQAWEFSSSRFAPRRIGLDDVTDLKEHGNRPRSRKRPHSPILPTRSRNRGSAPNSGESWKISWFLTSRPQLAKFSSFDPYSIVLPIRPSSLTNFLHQFPSFRVRQDGRLGWVRRPKGCYAIQEWYHS